MKQFLAATGISTKYILASAFLSLDSGIGKSVVQAMVIICLILMWTQ